jgi:predicted HTH domain antitoxin
MATIVMSVPDELSLALKIDPKQLGPEILLAAAMKLYELGRISSGVAAHLAGIPRPVFLNKVGEYGIATFRLSKDELLEDWQNARCIKH